MICAYVQAVGISVRLVVYRGLSCSRFIIHSLVSRPLVPK